MKPLPSALFFIVAAALTAPAVQAQTAESSPANPAPAAPVTDPAAPAPDRMRALSPATAARLAEKMPKFAPAKPAEPPPTSPVIADAKTTEPSPDLRDLDRPRNTIIRLPSYLVLDDKPPVFKERHLRTPKGRLDLALKRYPGLRFGSLPIFSNNGWALAMLEEDHRLERKAEMEDLVTLVTDPTDRAKAKAEVQKSFLRSDW